MEITFTKTAERRYTVVVRRDDGVVLNVPSFDRPSHLPHDIVHFIVESELSLDDGLWGLMAAGVLVPDVSVAAGRLPPRSAARSRSLVREAGQRATEAEVLVSLILQIAEEELDENWPEANARLSGAWQPRRSQRPPLTHDEVRRACRRLREVKQQWKELPIGESLSLSWPTRTRKRAKRPRR